MSRFESFPTRIRGGIRRCRRGRMWLFHDQESVLAREVEIDGLEGVVL